MEDKTQVDETINSSSDENTEENTGENLAEELERERQARQQLTARAKKAEEEARSLREKYEALNKEKEDPKPTQTASPDVEELILKSQGMSSDLLKELKVIAQVRGVSLIDAQSDPIFATLKENYEKEKKSSEASLGASKGSGQVKPKKDFNTPGLSRDEHREMFKNKL
jgi:hypothetical protein